MCGIAGIVATHASRVRTNLEAMVEALTHRGPDGTGIHVFRGCALGHTRLAIVDLVSGDQPMVSGDGKLGITFNGEIYGYRDIRRELADVGFRTTSDTEVLIALYERYHTAMMSRVPGMFAFAVWDENRQELFCARDRFGEKPFYYAFGPNGEFVFASEIKAIVASKLVEPKLSRTALAHYLERLYVHPYQSIYENVHVLPPGSILRFEQGRARVEPYWELPTNGGQIVMSDAVEEFRFLLRESIRKQLVADVPVGAFLSGGLDSSTIVTVANSLKTNLRTFSFDFEGDHTEIGYARSVAEKCGTDHEELSTTESDIGQLLLRMSEVYDEPFADSSNIPTFLLSEQARKHLKVVLTGDGGDELFAGYEWYKPLLWMERCKSPSALLHTMARVASRCSRWLNLDRASAIEQRNMGIGYKRHFDSILDAHRSQLELEVPSCLKVEYPHPDGRPTTAELPGVHVQTNTVDDALRYDLLDYMPGDILTKIDRASMAHGLELRAPYLDVDFASFCISLPHRLKLTESDDKLILRRAYAQSWPESVRSRHKQGFGAPLRRWIQTDSVVELQKEYLENPNLKIHQLLPLRERWQEIQKIPGVVWRALVLSIWMERWSFHMP